MITYKICTYVYEILLTDAYCCRKFSGTSPFPTKRLSGIGNFIGSVISLNQSVGFDSSNYCPEKCRPKNHKDWVYCWNNRKNLQKLHWTIRGHTYACNSLTNFGYEVHAMTGNGNYVKSEQVSWTWMQKLLSRKSRPKNHKYWVYCWNNFIHHSTHIFIRLHFIIHFGFIIN